MQSIKDQCQQAYAASQTLATTSTQSRNDALWAMANAILDNQDLILKANTVDIEAGRAAAMTDALIDRLTLSPSRIKAMSDGLLTIRDLPDPIGELISGWTRPNGLQISQIRVPLGVIGIIYEARPNVTADAIGLCLKTSNCVVLRGSSSAYNSNKAITDCMKAVLPKFKIPEDAIQLLEDTSRDHV